MENWFNHRNWKIMDDNNITDISDAIRWLELWHDGGLYLDLDTITLKQTDHLRNVAGIQNEYSKIGGGINGAVLQFSKPHHELLKPILDTYIHDWRGNRQEWGVKGPKLLTATLKNIFKCCESTRPEKCKFVDFEILGTNAFYPISFREKKLLVKPEDLKKALFLTNAPYTVHFWNKITKRYKIEIGGKSFYDVAASVISPWFIK